MQTSPRENDLIKVIKQLLTGIVLIVVGLLIFLLLSIFGWPDFSSPEEPVATTTTAAAATEEVSKIEPVTTLTEFWTAPDVNTLTDASAHFLVQLQANGQFMDLRGFLIDIGALPYFESIEGIEIKAVEGNTKEIGLKISLTRE